MTIQDKTASVAIALWRDLAHTNIQPGNYVHLANLVVSTFQNVVTLATTNQTHLEVCNGMIKCKVKHFLKECSNLRPGTSNNYECLNIPKMLPYSNELPYAPGVCIAK